MRSNNCFRVKFAGFNNFIYLGNSIFCCHRHGGIKIAGRFIINQVSKSISFVGFYKCNIGINCMFEYIFTFNSINCKFMRFFAFSKFGTCRNQCIISRYTAACCTDRFSKGSLRDKCGFNTAGIFSFGYVIVPVIECSDKSFNAVFRKQAAKTDIW